MRDRSRTAGRRSLVSVWLEQSAHPVVTLVVVLVLEAAALGGLVWWAGWHGIVHALSTENAPWFVLCAGGQVVAYFGYTLALRAVAVVDDGVRLDLAAAFGIVSVGFAPIFSANAGGGFSIDAVTLHEAGMTRRRAFRRVLALSALEYAVLAPAVAICGLLLFFHVGGDAAGDLALPWLAVIPGAIVAVWVTSPRHANWSRVQEEAGWLRRSFAHVVAALTVLRDLVVGSEREWTAFAGAALYWLGDMVTLWAALRVFDVRLSVPVLVLAYGTGWALTRRSLPFGGPGMVEILLAWVLTWFHVPFAPAAAGVVAYRLFNFWLTLVPVAIVIPLAKRLQRKLVREAAAS